VIHFMARLHLLAVESSTSNIANAAAKLRSPSCAGPVSSLVLPIGESIIDTRHEGRPGCCDARGCLRLGRHRRRHVPDWRRALPVARHRRRGDPPGACDAERRLGELTKRRLEALAGSGQIDLRADRPGQRDRYGRLLVRLFVNGEDAACVLIREGMPAPGAAAARIGASTSTRLRAWRGLSVPLPLRRAARLSELSPLRRVQRPAPRRAFRIRYRD
jgi:hypothetical protein